MGMLYHYTTIDTLELILKNKTIRFNRMDRVDDMQESELISKEFWSKYLFVSSWTRKHFESHSLWVYSKLNGVRIGLPEYPFKKYKLHSAVNGHLIIGDSMYSHIPFEKLAAKDTQFFLIPNKNWFMGGAVEYFAEPEKQKPPVFQDADGGIHFNLNNLARVKDIFWAEQQEFRYVLFILPAASPPIGFFTTQEDVLRLVRHYFRCLSSAIEPNISSFDIELGQELESIEITLGPDCTEAEKLRVRKLIKQFAPNGSVSDSRVSGNIRKPIRN